MHSVTLYRYPDAPSDLKAENVTASSVKLSWTAAPLAKSYVIRYGVQGEVADRLHYSETPTFTLNDSVFAGTLAGETLNITVASFFNTYDGKKPDGSDYDGATAEIKKANEAMAEAKPEKWSNIITVNFPASK